MKLVISSDVKNDICNIYKFIAKDSVLYANKTVNDIYSKIFELERFPYMGRYVSEITDKKYREIIYKNYKIFYEVCENENIIYVHFVAHNKRNFNSIYKYFKSL